MLWTIMCLLCRKRSITTLKMSPKCWLVMYCFNQTTAFHDAKVYCPFSALIRQETTTHACCLCVYMYSRKSSWWIVSSLNNKIKVCFTIDYISMLWSSATTYGMLSVTHCTVQPWVIWYDSKTSIKTSIKAYWSVYVFLTYWNCNFEMLP